MIGVKKEASSIISFKDETLPMISLQFILDLDIGLKQDLRMNNHFKFLLLILSMTFSLILSANEPYDVVVIGGGISGMSAAYELKKSGHKVLLLEGSDHLGGRLISDEIEGIPFDWAAQVIAKNAQYMKPLVKELGLENDLIEISSKVTYQRGEKLLQIDLKQPWTLFTSGLLDIRWSSSILSLFFDLPRLLVGAPWGHFNDYSKWWKLDKGNAQRFAAKYFDQDSIDYFLEPTVASFFYASLQESSQAFLLWYFTILAQGTPFFTLKNGLGSITPKLAARIDYKLNTVVSKVQEQENYVSIETKEGTSYQAKYVILAIPAPNLKTVYLPQSKTEESLIQSQYKKVIVLTMKANRSWHDQLALKDSYALFFSEKEASAFGSIAFESSKPGRLPPGQEILQIFLTSKVSDNYFSLSDQEIFNKVAPDLEKILPGFSQAVSSYKVKKWWNAMTLVPEGKSRLLHHYKNEVERGHKKVIFAGDYMNLPGTDGSRGSGLWAAEQIKERLRHNHQ